MQQGFTLPTDAAEAIDLSLGEAKPTKIAMDAIVTCRNRGNRPLSDTFDGRHITLPPGLFKVRYDAALHFQRRLIVPGTRNLQVGGYKSFIGIYGTADGQIKCDKDEDCAPFTEAELKAMGEKVEAIDRATADRPDVTPVRVEDVLARSEGFSSGDPLASKYNLGRLDAAQQANAIAAEASAHVLEPPAESATADAEAEAGVPERGRRGGRGR